MQINLRLRSSAVPESFIPTIRLIVLGLTAWCCNCVQSLWPGIGWLCFIEGTGLVIAPKNLVTFAGEKSNTKLASCLVVPIYITDVALTSKTQEIKRTLRKSSEVPGTPILGTSEEKEEEKPNTALIPPILVKSYWNSKNSKCICEWNLRITSEIHDTCLIFDLTVPYGWCVSNCRVGGVWGCNRLGHRPRHMEHFLSHQLLRLQKTLPVPPRQLVSWPPAPPLQPHINHHRQDCNGG